MLVSLTLLFKVWQPKHIFRFENQADNDIAESDNAATQTIETRQFSAGQITKAWMPFVILTAMVSLWSIKPFKDLFVKGKDGQPDGALVDMVVSIKVPFTQRGTKNAACGYQNY